jgi:hypothetical protein
MATLAFAHLSVLDFNGRAFDRAGWISALTLALIAPMYAPFYVFALAVLGMKTEDDGRGVRWRRWKSQGAVLIAVSAIGVLSPYLMLRLGGFQGIGSGVLYRSGLDGSTQYFTSMIQAVLAPFDTKGRAWAFVPLPATAALAVSGMWIFSPVVAAKMLRQLLVCLTPTLFWIAIFPQLVSIHPYYFDFGLIFPAAFCLAFWLMNPETHRVLMNRRALILALSIVLTGLLMTNLIDMARTRNLPLP